MKQFLLSILVLGIVITGFAACTKKPADSQTPTDDLPVEYQETAKEALGFDKEDNRGTEFQILVNNAATHFDMKADFIGDPTGSVVEQAVYKRAAECETYLGIFLMYKEESGNYNSSVIQNVSNLITAGSCPYDMLAIGLNTGILGKDISLFYNVLDMDSVNVDHDWWVQDTLEQVSVNGQLYFLSGDACMSTYGYLGCVFANLNVSQAFQQNVDYFELVEQKEWTMDRFFSLFRDVSTDIDEIPGIGLDDVFGWANVSTGVRVMWSSCDLSLFSRNELTDEIQLKSNLDQKMLLLIEKLKDAYDAPNSFYFGNTTMDKATQAFVNDRCLFYSYYVYRARSFVAEGGNNSAFAILPLPLYDEDQADYISTNISAYNALFFPSSVKNPSLAGKVAEFMGWSGKQTIIPTYYVTYLQIRSTGREEKNIDMLNLIRDKLRISPNELYGVIDDIVGTLALTDRNVIPSVAIATPFYSNPISRWASIAESVNQDIQEYIISYYR